MKGNGGFMEENVGNKKYPRFLQIFRKNRGLNNRIVDFRNTTNNSNCSTFALYVLGNSFIISTQKKVKTTFPFQKSLMKQVEWPSIRTNSVLLSSQLPIQFCCSKKCMNHSPNRRLGIILH